MDEAFIAALEIRDSETAEVAIEHLVALQLPEAALIAQGEQGPPGPPGPEGGVSLQRIAGEELSALRAVYELDGEVFVLDHQDRAHIDLLLGITLTAAPAGQVVNIQRLGALQDSAWSWTAGRVYLGAAGHLTQTPPDSGYQVLLGAAVASDRLTLNLTDPIEL
jgi:hypothetical protein